MVYTGRCIPTIPTRVYIGRIPPYPPGYHSREAYTPPYLPGYIGKGSLSVWLMSVIPSSWVQKGRLMSVIPSWVWYFRES